MTLLDYLFPRRTPTLPKDPLDLPVMEWDRDNLLQRRDILRSLQIFGVSGSGKSSSSGYQVAKALARDRETSSLILGQKPEDRAFWLKIFKQVGRECDLIFFSPTDTPRMNLMDVMQQEGADTRALTEFLITTGETLQRKEGKSGGGEEGAFWQQNQERLIWCAIELILQATGTVSVPALMRFLNSAPLSPEQLKTEQWQNGFCNQCVKAAWDKPKTPIQEADFRTASELILGEYASMADRTRSSILAGVMVILHTFSTGIVRDLISTTTTVTPALLEERKWLFVDTPAARLGVSGAFIQAGIKYVFQTHILRRQAGSATPIAVIWSDEANRVVNSFDAVYLAECRSHKGCLVYLAQSFASYNSAMGGHDGKHRVTALLANFGTKICHALDPETAQWVSSLIGRERQVFIGGSTPPTSDAWDQFWGNSHFSGSFNEQVHDLMPPHLLMNGLATGGPAHGFVCEAYVVRSEPFADGNNYLRLGFSQR